MNASYEKTPETSVLIRFPDCDPFGHLNNARYLTYFVNAREDHVRENYGLDIYQHAADTGKGWVVRGANIVYAAPAMNNERVRIQSRMIDLGSNFMTIEGVMRGTHGINAVSWVNLTYVDTRTGRPLRHDPALQALFENLVAPLGEQTDLETRVRILRRAEKHEQAAELAATH